MSLICESDHRPEEHVLTDVLTDVLNSLVCVFRFRSTRMKWDRVANTDTAELCERVESMMLADTNLGGDKSGSEKESADPKTRAALQPDEVAEEIQRLDEIKGVDSGSWMPFWLTLVPFCKIVILSRFACCPSR